MKIKVLTSNYGFQEAEIPDDFEFLRVTVMTGDEIIEVYRSDPYWSDPYLYCTIDPCKDKRAKDFFDVTYMVRRDQMETWNERGERSQNYYIFEHKKFVKTFKGYVSYVKYIGEGL